MLNFTFCKQIMKKLLIILLLIAVLVVGYLVVSNGNWETQSPTDMLYTELPGVSFEIPSSWTVESLTRSEDNQVDGSSFVHLTSPDVSTKTDGNVQTYTSGARISILIKGFNLDEDLNNAQAYAEYHSNNCAKCIDSRIVTVAGIPATYQSLDDKRTFVSLYKDNEIFTFGLVYGEQNTFEDFEETFFDFLASVKF